MPSSIQTQNLCQAFQREFGRKFQFCARAPGRVNLIGEHTDYNEGLALPMAIDRKIEIWFAPRDDSTINLYSANFDQKCSFSLTSKLEKDPENKWADYVKGVADILLNAGHQLNGFDGLVLGDIPVASGLSSSAALEVASVLTLITPLEQVQSKTNYKSVLTPMDIAKLAQRAEREFVGVNCGLMDQLISVAATRGSALKIDCGSMNFTSIAMPENLAIIVGDTRLSRALADSAYNQRRRDCDEAFTMIQKAHVGGKPIRSMRDIDISVMAASETYLAPALFTRIRHLATENQRVLHAVAALQNNDLEKLGKLFDASHASLRDDYEVSSDGLDRVTELMRSMPGCFGARLTGAGFGGCSIAAVDASVVDDFLTKANAAVSSWDDPKPQFFRTFAADGASVRSVIES